MDLGENRRFATQAKKIFIPAVIAGGIAHFMLGAIWYTVLAKWWLEGIGKTMADMGQGGGDSPLPHLVSFASHVCESLVIAWCLASSGEHTAARGAKIGFMLAVLVSSATTATQYAFEHRSVALFAINAGYSIVGMSLAGAVVGAWRRKEKSEAVKAAA